MSLIVCECARGCRSLRNQINSTSFCFFSVKSLLCHSLMCARLHPLVYSVGSSVGSLERLHHLFLPGCRGPVQGETPENLCIFVLIRLYRVEFLGCTLAKKKRKKRVIAHQLCKSHLLIKGSGLWGKSPQSCEFCMKLVCVSTDSKDQFQEDFLLLFLRSANRLFYRLNRNAKVVIAGITYSWLWCT